MGHASDFLDKDATQNQNKHETLYTQKQQRNMTRQQFAQQRRTKVPPKKKYIKLMYPEMDNHKYTQ